jgi:hypothetical protein
MEDVMQISVGCSPFRFNLVIPNFVLLLIVMEPGFNDAAAGASSSLAGPLTLSSRKQLDTSLAG